MLIHPYHLELDRQRRREARAAARRRGLVARQPAHRRVSHAVGRSMVSIGSRLAAEPAQQRARSL